MTVRPRALLSVSDKTGIVELARALVDAGVEVVSTGGTRTALAAAGIPVTSVSDVTSFPEILDGRVKTLHPAVHAGLLARAGVESDEVVLAEHGFAPIDWLVVNLYPFAETIARPDVTFADAVEQIDIGGPAMLRASAKNHERVTVLVDPSDYEHVISMLANGGRGDAAWRRHCATKAFQHTAAYDATIAQWLARDGDEQFPDRLTVTYRKVQDLRYGENPHQQAAFYAELDPSPSSIAGARQLHGTELSYNNIADAHAALAIVSEFEQPAAVVVKHTNPCGVGIGATIHAAYVQAHDADPISIFGGIVALNRTVDAATAAALSEVFLEVVIAPAFDEDALATLSRKPRLRLLKVAASDRSRARAGAATPRAAASVGGGLLVQDSDEREMDAQQLVVVTRRAPTETELDALLFAWRVVKHVKSNAVVLARAERTVGIGAGQMNRVGAARIAIEQAGELAAGSVLASDAFFPMPDTVQAAADAGVTAVIQPGGSKQDAASIEVCDAAGIAMVFTSVRHFRH